MIDIIPYLDIYEANEYFSTRLNTESWDYATETEKLKSLVDATRSINALNFRGNKLINQVNEFPRIGSTVPDDIKIATCEIAIRLLDGIDIEQEINNLFTTSRSYASINTGNNLGIVPDHLRAGISSVVAWHHLRPYLKDPLICRVNERHDDDSF